MRWLEFGQQLILSKYDVYFFGKQRVLKNYQYLNAYEGCNLYCLCDQEALD